MNSFNERKFEVVSNCDPNKIIMPRRATSCSAGYDICACVSITIPSIWRAISQINTPQDLIYKKDCLTYFVKPTLVPTGIKVRMPRDNMLLLYNRSSNPLKRGLVLANGVGVIDADYYNNPSNEGEIFGSFYNFGASDYTIHAGDVIMQGVFKDYLVTSDDNATGNRTGGFSSTDKQGYAKSALKKY